MPSAKDCRIVYNFPKVIQALFKLYNTTVACFAKKAKAIYLLWSYGNLRTPSALLRGRTALPVFFAFLWFRSLRGYCDGV